MAKRNVVAVAMVAAALAVSAAFAPAAQADTVSVQDYKREMRALLNDIQGWNQELDVHLAAMQTKPEIACSAEFGELVARGGWMADDLAGTALNAPAPLMGLNQAAAEGLKVVVSGAGQVAADCDGTGLEAGAEKVRDGRAQYAGNIARVRAFVIGFAGR